MTSQKEHHSNTLPWRELPQSQVILIPDKEDGTIDLAFLQQELKTHSEENKKLGDKKKTLLVGCFMAASNITGLLQDDLTITSILHQYGALAFWDYATAAPHTYIDVNPKVIGDVGGLCRKDAIYFSCHKFVGGVQTPGILIAKKKLFTNDVPDGAGGGTVLFVTNDDHRYLKDPEHREEGGTPAIVGSIRAGLAVQLKQSVGIDYIVRREHELMKLARQQLESSPNFVLLGNGFVDGDHHSLSILSFLIKAPSDSRKGNAYLHHNYVSVLLNDMFGIQCRGGCACAGPYAITLLGIPNELVNQYLSQLDSEDDESNQSYLRRGNSDSSMFEVLKPGFTRLNLAWSLSNKELNFVLDALLFIAEHGWKMMPQYTFNTETGDWRHHTNQVLPKRQLLGNISYAEGKFTYPSTITKDVQEHSDDDGYSGDVDDYTFENVMLEAKQLISEASEAAQKIHIPDQRILFEGQAAMLRWMILPIEAKEALVLKSTFDNFDKITAPFTPKTFKISEESFNYDDNNSTTESDEFR